MIQSSFRGTICVPSTVAFVAAPEETAMTLPLVFKCGKLCLINSTTANKLISYNLFQSSTEVDSIGPTGSKTPAFAIIEFNCPNFEIAS